MSRKILILMLLGFTVVLIGCKKEIKSDESGLAVQSMQVYYTQFSLYQEKDNFRTTNYRKGVLIPINTPVNLISIDADKAQLRLQASGQPLTIENVPKFTKDSMAIAFSKIAGTNKVDLSVFTPAEQASILAGQVKKGMRKKAVLAALGYPPQHETPTLEADAWTYWSNRFNRFIVNFKNDKVDSIVD